MEHFLKRFTAISTSMLILAICSFLLLIAIYLPEKGTLLVRAFCLSLLGINLLACILKRLGTRNKWSLRRIGILVFHTGIILLIIALLYNLQTEKTYVELAEDQARNLKQMGYPVSLKVERVRLEFHPGGSVKQYYTRVSLIENGQVLKQAEISVNHPLVYKGLKVYQTAFKPGTTGNISGLTIKSSQGLEIAGLGALFLLTGSVGLARRR
ncbi:MAG: cytochrome c biogenesis protein ResB [Syntrophomonas sp.]